MKKRIAVIFGGKSVEHDVSIITAHVPIIQSLEASGQFDVWPIYIAKDGAWYADKVMNDLAYFRQADMDGVLAGQKKIQLLFDNGLKIIWPGFRNKSVTIDAVFPAMHGTFGEDGSLMGLLRMAGVAFVGCDMAASAIAMDKALTKQVLAAEQMGDVRLLAGEEVVDAHDVVPLVHQPLAKMRTEEPGPASHQDALSLEHG